MKELSMSLLSECIWESKELEDGHIWSLDYWLHLTSLLSNWPCEDGSYLLAITSQTQDLAFWLFFLSSPSASSHLKVFFVFCFFLHIMLIYCFCPPFIRTKVSYYMSIMLISWICPQMYSVVLYTSKLEIYSKNILKLFILDF